MASAGRAKRLAASGYRRAIPDRVRRRLWRARRGIGSANDLDQPLLTVVMPVYNVERYLDEAVQSVLSQSYRHLELLLVDDGATDRSGAMCDEYAAHDQRVRVIHQTNAGLGAARNTGIASARGSLICFADSDDYVLPNSYARMVRSLSRSGSDLVTGNVQRRYGNELEQSWIQLRSHAADVSNVTLAEHPELLFDTVAWNKIFRTDFWNEHGGTFPPGKLYEDTATIFRALLGARAIDVISAPVYVWRLRDERDSITQRLLELRNIDDRFEMLDRVEEMIRAADLWDLLGPWLQLKILDVDLWVYVRAMNERTRAEALERVQELTAHHLPGIPDWVKLGIPGERRIAYLLLAAGRFEDMLVFRWWYATVESALPLRQSGAALLLDLSSCPVGLDGLSDIDLDMSDVAEPIVNVTAINWTSPGLLTVRGYGYTKFVSKGGQRITIVATNQRSGQQVEWTADRLEMHDAARWAGDMTSPHDNDGFECAVDIEQLTVHSDLGSGDEWSFSASIDDGDIRRSTPLNKIWKLGSGAVLGSSLLADGTLAIAKTDLRHGLRVVLDNTGRLAETVATTGRDITIRPQAGTPAVNAVRLADADGNEVSARRRPDGTFVATVPKPPPTAGCTSWRLIANGGEGDQPLLAPAGLDSSSTPSAHGVHVVVTRTGHAVIEVCQRTAIVDDLKSVPNGDVELGGFLLSLGDFEAGLAPEGGTPRVWYPASVVAGRFQVRIAIADQGGALGRPLPAGKYTVQARTRGTDGLVAAEIRLLDAAARGLPVTSLAETVKTRLLRNAGGFVGVEVAAPVADELLGRYAQTQLIDRHTGDERELEDAVFFLVDVGANAGDSALAIHNELRRRGTTMRLYWGVEDLSVAVPEGGIPVLKRTEEWFAAVNHSRFLVNNYGGMWGLRKASGQRYLQTWHGTPYKFIGASESRHRGAAKIRFDRIAEEGQEWDAFVSPSPYFSGLVPTEFLYEGPILETGYPRNDRLATVEAAEQVALRDSLGVPRDAKVLLYAPTFRDSVRRGWRAPLYDGLDLNELLRHLGPEWIVMLRGHIFNANDDHADRSAGRLVDVTRHGDINDLYIASDLLVTDYSSVMFDYSVTGKPIAFFAPDLDTYVAMRGAYFDLRAEAPGPVCRELADLVGGLRDLEAVAARYQDKYNAFREKYTPWDDGKAAARVVDSFFI